MTLDDDGVPDPDSAYDVPPDTPVHRCPDCGAPFPSEDDRWLHRELVHPEAIDEADREALAAAREREETALRRFRLKALGAVVVLYFLLLMVYALV